MNVMAIDYTKISSVARVRYYISDDPDLPMEEWKMIKDVPIFLNSHFDDTAHKTGKRQYLTCRYVFIDGELSGFADVQVMEPNPKVVMKQRRDLN